MQQTPLDATQRWFGSAPLTGTPLMYAARQGRLEAVGRLADLGAALDLVDPDGNTALMFAADLGWRDGSPLAPAYEQGLESEALEAIDLCLSLGLDIDAANKTGETALHAAVSGRGSPAIVRRLLERGADPTQQNALGRTALELAEADRRDRSAIADLLRSAAR